MDLSAVDALKESWRITTGHKMNLLVFGVLGVGVVLVGMMACCVGIFPATAVIAIAQVFIYERLISQDPPPAIPPVSF